MIRHAELGDKERAIILLRESHEAAGYTFQFHAAYAEKLYNMHFTSTMACCLFLVPEGLGPQGILLAAVGDHPFGAGLYAQETVWYIRDEYRGRGGIKMIQYYEQWARTVGCKSISMAALASNDVSTLYERYGYKQAETHFIKAL